MRNFLILLQDNVVHSFRSKKALIFLILYLIIFLLIAYGIITFQKKIDAEFERAGIDKQQKEFALNFAKTFLKAQSESKMIDYLLSIPFLNLALFLVSLFGTPLLILILKYDVLAQENYDHTTRFLLFRISRSQLLWSKYLSSVMEIMLLTLFAFVVVMCWAALVLPDFRLAKSLRAGLYFYGVSQLIFGVIIAYSLAVSALVQKPFTALLLSFLGIFLLLIIPLKVPYVSPFDHRYVSGLFYGLSPQLLFSVGVYLAFIIGILLLTQALFSRRNL